MEKVNHLHRPENDLVFSSWCYNQNNRSTLSVILLHAGSNLAMAEFLMTGPGENIFKMLLVLDAVIIAVFWMIPNRKLAQKGNV